MNIRKILAGLVTTALVAGVVSCGGSDEETFAVGGTIAGSAGVVLRLNGGSDLSVPALGSFNFPTRLTPGTQYVVTVASAAQPCTVANGSGTIGSSDLSSVSVSCTTVVRTASLTGAQENPAVVSAATGRGAVVVNPTTREITGGMMFTGLTPTTGGHHIHQAPNGRPTENGPVIIRMTLAPGGGVATVPGGTVLTEAQYTAYLAGELYFNVHTAANIGGEIRGQITSRSGVTAGLATLTGAQEVPPNSSTATGRGTIVFDSATRDVLVAYATHDVAATTVAHIHTGAAGVSGPANVVTLTQGTGVYTSANPSALTVQNVADINAGNTYFNVHSTSIPAGEIRGQIAIQ